jgi:hydroxyethylthiazole kinase-like uncharacterized protein yjeF
VAVQRFGVDVLGIERMALAVRRSGDGFLTRSFTEAELAYCGGSAEKLAGRWAAKEAVIKCFDGTPLCFPRRRIEVLPAASGAPRVTLLGDSSGASVQVSITHQAGVAIATAVLELAGGAELLPPPAAVRVPRRSPDANKGTFGTVVLLAGSLGLTGAAYLSAMGAARGGAGKVRLLCAQTIYPILAAKCVEVMAMPVPEVAPGAPGHADREVILRQFEDATAALVGPGLGRDRSTWRLIHDLLEHLSCPLVVDADGLNALAEDRRLLGRLRGDRVLTPHPGEMGRLLRRRTAEVQADRPGAAAALAKESGAVVVLKGARTLVAAPDGRLSEDPHEVPALATGGTGDVLGGLIAALLAQGLEPFDAAATGVYVHAAAGRRIAQRLGDSGLLASDLLLEIPPVMQLLREAS